MPDQLKLDFALWTRKAVKEFKRPIPKYDRIWADGIYEF
jgi:hypothetical protein